MKKFRKRVLVVGLASSLVLGMCTSAMAASVYVGNTGFYLGNVINDTTYAKNCVESAYVYRSRHIY